MKIKFSGMCTSQHTLSPIGDFGGFSIIPSPKRPLQPNPALLVWVERRARSPDHNVLSRILNRGQIGAEQLLAPSIGVLPTESTHHSDIVAHHVDTRSLTYSNALLLALDVVPFYDLHSISREKGSSNGLSPTQLHWIQCLVKHHF